MDWPVLVSWLQKNTNRLVQIGWLVFAVLVLGLTLAGLSHRFAELQVVCNTPHCISGQATAEFVAALEKQGEIIDEAAMRDGAFSSIANSSLLSFFIFALGGVLIWQRPDKLPSVLAAFVFTSLAVLVLGMPDALARARPEYTLPVRLLHLLVLAGLYVVFNLLPDGRFRWRWQPWLAAAFVLVTFIFTVIQGATLDMPLAAENAVFGMLLVGATLSVAIILLLRYREARTEITRQQLKWILLGTGLAVGWFACLHLLYFLAPGIVRGYWSNFIGIIDFIVIIASVGCVAVSILQFQLFDIDIVINRGLVYGALTVFIVATYALVVGGLSVAFSRLAPAGDALTQVLAPLIATSLIVLAFQPLRERLQRGVNRLMYGERDEPYQVLTRLAERLESALDVEAALPLTVETIAHALKLPYVAITLKQDGNYKTVAAFGSLQNEIFRFPLTYAGETIGELAAAARNGEETFSIPDSRLLNDLARQLGVTAHTVLLAADLERARLRIVETREEARRQLGSDLHDGVGHQLAGLRRQAERAANLTEQDATSARDLLADIKTQLDSTIGLVRQLAHQLYPPELELLGLAGALRERVQASEDLGLMVKADLPEKLPTLPTAVESAAYYIALEALTNVSKHARARVCNLHLGLTGEHEKDQISVLELEICDDGHGLLPTGSGGLGLISMQGRAAEVGGVCTIETNPGGGTRVLAHLPLKLREE